jgi:hypothetical protein
MEKEIEAMKRRLSGNWFLNYCCTFHNSCCGSSWTV